MSRHGLSMLAAVACFLLGNQLLGSSAKDLMKALDLEGVPGIELVKQEYIKYKFDKEGYPEEDEVTGEHLYTYSTTSKWTVQRGNWGKQGLYSGVSPLMGGTCVRSGVGTECTASNDGLRARMVFKVSSGGILRFSYLTACDTTDGIIVYVDGQEVERYFDGYGTGVIWGKDPEFPDGEEYGRKEITIDGGLAPEGSAYAGTYDHEVVFEFYKDEPNYGWDDHDRPVYSSLDEPEKPQKDEYVWDGVFDKENYDLDMAEYYSFRNSVWLDNFQWIPISLEIQVGFGDVTQPLELVDGGGVLLSNNALDYGYSVRYTLDGTEPTAASPLYIQSADEEQAVTIERSCTVKAMIFDSANNPVQQTLVSRQIVVKGSQPVLKVEKISDDEALVSMTGFEKNEIHYTLNGVTPSETSSRYMGTPVSIKKPLTVKAIATRDGITPSPMAELVIFQAVKPASPTVSEPNHIYTGDGGLTVTCEPIQGSQLIYRVDGGQWKEYSGALTVTATTGNMARVEFRNRETDKLASDIVETVIYKATEPWLINGGEGEAENVLAFANGWTLVGAPASLNKESEELLLQTFHVMGYNADKQCYEQATSFQEGNAYWVFKSKLNSNKLEVFGVAKNDKTLENLTAGWNAYGPAKSGESVTGKAMTAWTWRNERFEMVGDSEELKRGQGYFIFNNK